MSNQPPSPSDFHGRATTLLTATRGVTQQEAVVALADAATGLLGMCIEQVGKDAYVLDLEAKLEAARAAYARLVGHHTSHPEMAEDIDALRIALFGLDVKDF